MRTRPAFLLVICFLASAWPSIVVSEDATRGGESRAEENAAPSRSRKRWDQLPLEQRQRLARLYERLKELPPEKRKLLLERLRASDPVRRREVLERAKRELDKDWIERDIERERRRFVENQLRNLPSEEQERLKKLSPEEKRSWIATKTEERRRRLVSKLPPRLGERIEKLPPREQLQWIQSLQGERVFKQTFTDPVEVEKIRALEPRQVREALRVATSANPPKRPEWMSEATWSRWLLLKPFERPRAMRGLFNPGSSNSGSPTQALQPRGGHTAPAPGAVEKRQANPEKKL